MKIKRLNNKAILPRYSTAGSSAFDVFAHEDVKWKLEGGNWVAIVPTGWAFSIPAEHGLFIFSRSGHGFKHNTTLANSVGLLDYDYTGELMVKLIHFGDKPPEIEAGKAVAQCVLAPTPKVFFCEAEDLKSEYANHAGFGSTDAN